MPLRYRFLTKFQKLLIVGTLSWPSSQIHAQVDFAFDQHVHAPGQGSHFGDALALSGQTLAAVDYDAGGSDAYIYLRDGNGWSPQAAIDLPGWNPQPTITPGAHARGRVALAGDILVVGSPGDTIGGQADTGSIRIYRRSVGSWSFQQRIDRPAAASIVGNFGASVAIDGDRMVVGAPGRTAYGRGSVYEYARSGNNWSLAATIESPVEFGRSFGQSLALAGDRLVIGLPHARRAMVYRRVGSTWQAEASFTPASADPSVEFGASVALSGDYAFVGAPSGPAPDGKAVHVYFRSGGTWGLTQRLAPIGASRFGRGLAVSGARLAVGDPDQLDAVTQRRGRVHIYERNGLFWEERQTLRYPVSPSSALADFSGRLAIDAQTLLAYSALPAPGASGDDGQIVAYRQAVPSLQLSTPLAFGAVAIGSTSAARDLALSNTGSAPLTISAIQSASAPFARISGGSCGTLLPIVIQAGGSCTLRYTFAPTLAGTANQAIAFTSNDPAGGQTATLTGSGVVAELTVTPGELFVGSTVVGVATTPATLTLSNAGPLTVTVLGFTNPTAPFSSVAGGTCLAPPFALAPGQSCTRRYVYTPTSSGFHTALFSVTSSAINSPHAVSLSGFADGPGLALGNGTQLDFGTLAVGAPSATLTQTLTSTGVTDVLVQSIDTPVAPFERVGGDCPTPPFALPPDVACTLIYRFTPQMLGAAAATVAVSSDATPAIAAFNLLGIGAEPALLIGNHPLDLGGAAVGQDSPVKSATLSNVGNVALTVQTIGSASAPFERTGGSCATPPFGLAPGVSCTLDYRFTAAALGGAQQDLAVESDAPGSPHLLTLLGKGTLSALALVPLLQDFGTIAVSQTADASLTLESTGNSALTVQSIGAAAAPFGLALGSCPPAPFVLDPGQSCTIPASFAPTAKGLFEATVPVAHLGDVGPVAISLRGRGAPSAPSLAPGSLDFGAVGVGEPGPARVVTLSNTAPVELAVGTLALSGGLDFALQTDTCTGQTIPASGSCQFSVRFQPMLPGATADLVSVPSDAVGPPATLTVQGDGVIPMVFRDGFE